MKKFAVIILALGVSFYFLGCAKKEQPLEEMQAPMSMESLSNINTATPEGKVPPMPPASVQQAPVMPAQTLKTEVMPQPPYKPTNEEVQAALKNAGFYTGVVDGKIGPMSKKAIEEFQKVNNLQVDGKVGQKTWMALIKYLTQAPAAPAANR